MNTPLNKFFMSAVFIYVLMISAVWADRVLIDDPQQTVSVSNNFSCYRPADVTVDTTQPEIYEADSSHLQKLSDSVRAMLSFECPQLPSIKLTGLIRGLDEVVYQGEMNRSNNWLIQSLLDYDPASTSDQTTELPDDHADEAWANTHKRYDDELKSGYLEVTGLKLGMDVDQVIEKVTHTFGVEPVYDANNGVLTMSAGQCFGDFESVQDNNALQGDSKCLKAWFSDNRVPRLERLNLVQVVESQIPRVNDLLIEKYGNPTESKTSKVANVTQLTWRAINEQQEQSVIEEIEAVMTTGKNNLVITDIKLYNTALTQGSGNDDYADLDLKL